MAKICPACKAEDPEGFCTHEKVLLSLGVLVVAGLGYTLL